MGLRESAAELMRDGESDCRRFVVACNEEGWNVMDFLAHEYRTWNEDIRMRFHCTPSFENFLCTRNNLTCGSQKSAVQSPQGVRTAVVAIDALNSGCLHAKPS